MRMQPGTRQRHGRTGVERYLNDWDEIVDAVDYVNTNPRKHDLPDQHWDFVVPAPANV